MPLLLLNNKLIILLYVEMGGSDLFKYVLLEEKAMGSVNSEVINYFIDKTLH